MNSPKHTVILGSYNRPKLVRQAISSVLGQTVADWQLLIADDGSNEETLASIRDLIGQDRRCELLTAPHIDDALPRPDCANRAVQRINDAIKFVRGEVVHYLADDDWYDLRRFGVFDDLFSNPDIVAGYGRLNYADGNGTPLGLSRYFEVVSDPCQVLDQNQVAHRRLVFERIPKWPHAVDWASDGHFLREISRHWKFHGIDRLVAFKREHSMAMCSTQVRTTGKRE